MSSKKRVWTVSGKDAKPLGYAVYWFERLQDGHEEGAKVFGPETPLQEVLAYCSTIKNAPFTGAYNIDVRLFTLGREIPLEEVREEVPQPPPKTAIRFQVKGETEP